jgi:hypothetical protein
MRGSPKKGVAKELAWKDGTFPMIALGKVYDLRQIAHKIQLRDLR